MTFVTAEREVLGTDHAEIGAAIVEKWNLPDDIGRTARWHHAPMEMPSEVDHTLVELVHVADGLAHVLGHGADVGKLSRRVAKDVARRLRIEEQRLERVASETLAPIQDIGQLLA